MSLELLPTELQCQVIRLLEPISLISVSQVNTHFRGLIKPKKRHFAERLLALELTSEYGGLTPVFCSRKGTLEPGWHDEAWETMRWACTDCLRLLPHKSFDNHAILRLGYRKPIPKSSASEMITTWEPTGYTRPRDKNRERAMRDAQDTLREEKKRRQRYFLAVTGGLGNFSRHFIDNFEVIRDCGMDGFQGLSVSQVRDMGQEDKMDLMDQNAISIELEECGKKRWLRKCNECRFQRGTIWQEFNATCGTRRVPIVPSRRIEFASQVDRYFPGFSDFLDHKRPSYNVPVWVIHREDACEQLWSMWMIRCPTCERWQELRALRIGGMYQHWKPERWGIGEEGTMWDDEPITEEMLNEAACNSCFAESNGRQELGRVLSELLLESIGWEMRRLTMLLTQGFRYLQHQSSEHLPKKYAVEWKRIVSKTPCLDRDYRDILTHNDIALLRLRREEWKAMWEEFKRNVGDGQINEELGVWTEEWMPSSDRLEEHWAWMNGCSTEIEEKPEALVEWALSRDGASFT